MTLERSRLRYVRSYWCAVSALRKCIFTITPHLHRLTVYRFRRVTEELVSDEELVWVELLDYRQSSLIMSGDC